MTLLLHSTILTYIDSALKIGGTEILRENWDEVGAIDDDEDEDAFAEGVIPRKRPNLALPDWTRVPLPPGAPPAPRPPRVDPASAQAEVGA